jgi:hypothetical protein
MKLITKKNPIPSLPVPATLYVFWDSKKDVVAATFSARLAGMIEKSALFGAPEKHTAKAANIRGMYGKLFGLSKVQSIGGKKACESMTSVARHERAVRAAKARWSQPEA